MKPAPAYVAFDPSRLQSYSEKRKEWFPWVSTIIIGFLSLVALGIVH